LVLLAFSLLVKKLLGEPSLVDLALPIAVVLVVLVARPVCADVVRTHGQGGKR